MKVLGWCLGLGLVLGAGVPTAGAVGALLLAGRNSDLILTGLSACTLLLLGGLLPEKLLINCLS
jgi:hypothetical protein